MSMVFVVTAAFEFDATAYGSELIGVYKTQSRAFEALEKFDFMKVFKVILIGEKINLGHVSKEFGVDDTGNAFYSEQHYASSGEVSGGGSVILSIFEREVE